jgi:hypothetical protein
LQESLGSKGYDAWLDAGRISGGANWTGKIEAAIDGCEIALALVSTGSFASDLTSQVILAIFFLNTIS